MEYHKWLTPLTLHLRLYTAQCADTEAKPQILRVQLANTLPTASDFLTGISNSATEDGGEDHLDVFWEGIVVDIVEVTRDPQLGKLMPTILNSSTVTVTKATMIPYLINVKSSSIVV